MPIVLRHPKIAYIPLSPAVCIHFVHVSIVKGCDSGGGGGGGISSFKLCISVKPKCDAGKKQESDDDSPPSSS